MEVILSQEKHFRKVQKAAAVKIISSFRAKVILKYLFCIDVNKLEYSKNLYDSDELGLHLGWAGDVGGDTFGPDGGPDLVQILGCHLAPAPGGQLPVNIELLEDNEVSDTQDVGRLVKY